MRVSKLDSPIPYIPWKTILTTEDEKNTPRVNLLPHKIEGLATYSTPIGPLKFYMGRRIRRGVRVLKKGRRF